MGETPRFPPFRDVLSGPDAFKRLPQISRDDIKYLWDYAYWDGPLSGLLLYKGRKYWFENPERHWPDSSDEEFASIRRFFVIELSPEQLGEQERQHNLFREFVGLNADYDEHARRKVGAQYLRPQKLHHRYYDLYDRAPKLDLSTNPVIGWFEMRRGDGSQSDPP